MRALTAYRVEEELGPLDPPLQARYAFQAPDRMRFELDTGQRTIRIAQHAFTRRPGEEEWRIRTGSALDVPDHIWDYPDPVAVREVGVADIDGVATRVVAFFLRANDHPVWYRLWMDEDRLVRRAEMRASGHFMDHRYLAFDEPVDIHRPVGPLAIVVHEWLGARPGWRIAATSLRTVSYGATLLALGVVVFLGWITDVRLAGRRRPRQIAAAAAGTGIVAMLLTLPVQIAAGHGTAAIALPHRWRALLAGQTGLEAVLVGAGLLVVLASVPRWPRRISRWGAVLGGIVAAGAFVVAGHSLTAEPGWLAAVANVVHLIAAAVWFGLVVLLAVGLATWGDDDAEAAAVTIARSSAAALWSVAVLLPAGVALAVAHGRSLDRLVAAPYGWTLAAKIAVVAGVVAIGAYNNRRLVPAVRRGSEPALHRLRTAVRIEAVILVGVLVLTAVLVALPLPPP